MRNPILRSVLLLATCVLAQAQTSAPEANAKVEIRGGTSRGFVHPGIGFTKGVLENARLQVMVKREPWWSAYQKLAAHANSAEKVSCRNQSTKDPSRPDSDTFDSRGMEARLKGDADKALRQALMYWFTAKQCHRANAMNIIRTWAKLDPKKFKSFPEDHIHASYPVQNLIIAAELSRYSAAPWPDLAWTVKDTEVFTKNFVTPAVTTFFDRNGHFMNQAGYPMAAAIAGYIFTNDRGNYEKRVEWFTMNKDAPNKGWSFSVQHLARLVDTDATTGRKVSPPNIQLVEMGRDQAHAGGDIDIFMNISRMLNAQGTRVDPVTGTVSAKPDAVGPYEFFDDRILAAADHFCRFMLGYETPWIPTPSDIGPDGNVRRIYPRIADNYRGRIRGFDFWDAHYHYTYQKGVDVSKKAPYYDEAFRKRIVNSDTDWIFIPAKAGGEGARVPATEQEPEAIEVELRSTVFDSNAVAMEEDGAGFVRVTPAKDGTRIAILSADTDSKTVWLRFRSTEAAVITMSRFKKPWIIPNSAGEWREVAYTMDGLERFGDIVFFDITSPKGGRIDFDKLVRKPGTSRVAPEFRNGGGELRRVAYVGAPVRLDFATTRAARIDGIDKPADATLDAAGGAFEWTPKSAGEVRFSVTATDGDAVSGRNVVLHVMSDRRAALDKVAEAHDPQTEYVKAGVVRCKALFDEATAALGEKNEAAFYQKLESLQEAFGKLEPLTPLLADGSMDFPGLIAVTTAKPGEIALLTDGNDDTFAVYTSAKDLGHVFDFGEGFRFSASAFAAEGRLNFESRTQDAAFFGSNDGRDWTQLTPAFDLEPTELTRVTVDEGKQGMKFRYLKFQKTSRKSAPIFEPSEIRVFGRRYEAD
jgi:hypothetical protein